MVFFYHGGVVSLFQGFLNFATPITVEDGIFFDSSPEQREANPVVLWLMVVLPAPIILSA